MEAKRATVHGRPIMENDVDRAVECKDAQLVTCRATGTNPHDAVRALAM